MKKLLAVLLAAVMVCVLGACGSSSSSGGNAAGSGADVAPSGETVTLTMSMFDSGGSFNDQIAQMFIDKVDELSGGTVQFQYFNNGSFCSLFEDYDYVCNGTVDCSWTYPGPNMTVFPWGYANVGNQGPDDAVALANFIYKDDEACRDIMEKYGRDLGAICLGTVSEGGMSVAMSSKPITCWDDFKALKNGATKDQDTYIAMGHNVTTIAQADVYDSLSRGVCDFSVYNTGGALSLKMYEVAPYAFGLGVDGNALTLYMNYDKWDSLSAEQQGWINEATEYVTAYSLEQAPKNVEELKGLVDEWIEATPEEADYITQMMAQAAAQMTTSFAESLKGQEGLEDMIYVIRVQEEWLGMDILPEQYASYRDTVKPVISK